jgi:hypothetical protein
MQCKWNQDPNKRLRVWIFSDNGDRNYPSLIKIINEAKSWCKVSGINFFDDSFFSIRFTNEDDLNFFMLRWS